MTRNTIKPPGELGDYGLRLWRSITSLYELSPAEFELLWQACATADLIGALQDELLDGPALVSGRAGQMVAHPLIATLADQRRLLDGLIRSLSLPMPDEQQGRRRSPVAQAAAQQRWRQQRSIRRG